MSKQHAGGVKTGRIASRLRMGRVSTVQTSVSRFRTRCGPAEEDWEKLKKHETLGWYHFGLTPATTMG